MDEFLQEVDPAILILVGAFVPLVLAVVNRAAWSSEVTALVSFIVIVAVGVGVGLVMGMRDAESLMIAAAATYALSQTAYRGVWKPTGVSDQIEKTTG